MAKCPESGICESGVYSLKEIVNRELSFRLRSMTGRFFCEAWEMIFSTPLNKGYG